MKKLIQFDPMKAIRYLPVTILVLLVVIVVQTSNLQEQRKQTLAQADLCIKSTSDAIANYQLALMREQAAHKDDIRDANTKIQFLVTEYNKIITNSGARAKAKVLNIYSYLMHQSTP